MAEEKKGITRKGCVHKQGKRRKLFWLSPKAEGRPAKQGTKAHLTA